MGDGAMRGKGWEGVGVDWKGRVKGKRTRKEDVKGKLKERKGWEGAKEGVRRGECR